MCRRVLCVVVSVMVSFLSVAEESAQECSGVGDSITPTSAFVLNADGTVLDKRTGLIWDRCLWGQSGWDCSSGAGSLHGWQESFSQVELANSTGYKGHNDWRLPNIKELNSIVDRRCSKPAVNLEIFPNTDWDTGNYRWWSSSPYFDNSAKAWAVWAASGSARPSETANENRYKYQVRLVRGSQVTD